MVAQLMNECLSYDPNARPSAKQIYDRLTAAQAASGGGKSANGQSSSSGQSSGDAALQPAPASNPVAASGTAGQQQGGAGYPDLYREPGAPEAAQKAPTPLGRARLPIKSAFDMAE